MRKAILCLISCMLVMGQVVLPFISIAEESKNTFMVIDHAQDFMGLPVDDKLDQSMDNIGDPDMGWPIGGSHLGFQLFKPKLPVLTRVKLYVTLIRNPGPLNVEVWGLSGLLLGKAKGSVMYEGPADGWMEFDFEPDIVVVPEMTYLISCHATGDVNNHWWWQANEEGTYERGMAICFLPELPGIFTLPNLDFAFKTYGKEGDLSIEGPENVPGTSIYKYTAMEKGKTVSGVWTVENGNILGNIAGAGIGRSIYVQWDEGPAFGTIKVQSVANTGEKQVNIVHVEVTTPTNAFQTGTPQYAGTNISKKNKISRVMIQAGSHDPSKQAGLEWKAETTLTGPKDGNGDEQGVDKIMVRFVQNGKINKKRSINNSYFHRRFDLLGKSDMETKAGSWTFDIIPPQYNPNFEPPYFDGDEDAIHDGGFHGKTKTIQSEDSPLLGAKEWMEFPPLGKAKKTYYIDEIHAEVEFMIYIVASTEDDDYTRQTIVSQANWVFNADGTLAHTGLDWVWTAAAHAGVTAPASWTLVTSGEQPPKLEGKTLVDYSQEERYYIFPGLK